MAAGGTPQLLVKDKYHINIFKKIKKEFLQHGQLLGK